MPSTKPPPLSKKSMLKRVDTASLLVAPPMDDGAIDAGEGSIIAKSCFQGVDLLAHEAAIRAMMRDGSFIFVMSSLIMHSVRLPRGCV